MPLLLQPGAPQPPPPSLTGNEVLLDPRNPEVCMVKGIMFAARHRFLKEQFGQGALESILAPLSARTRAYAENPLASSWCEFASLVEFDRTIHERLGDRHPNILSLVGAASAEYGIGKVYRVLDSVELMKFLEGIVLFHERFQKYGRVVCTATPAGAQMAYLDYVCHSPIFCASAIGFFLEAILRHGGRQPHVEELKCTCRGDGVCLYDLQWSQAKG
jgi:hypothetical protein